MLRPATAQVNKELLFGGRGALSAEEANLARWVTAVR